MADPEPAHVVTVGGMTLRVFPKRNWLVLMRRHNGTINTVGMSGDEIPDAAALLRTAADWLADHREPAR